MLLAGRRRSRPRVLCPAMRMTGIPKIYDARVIFIIRRPAPGWTIRERQRAVPGVKK